jgi:hypothetical protein
MEKGGKYNEGLAHQDAEAYLDGYIDAGALLRRRTIQAIRFAAARKARAAHAVVCNACEPFPENGDRFMCALAECASILMRRSFRTRSEPS